MIQEHTLKTKNEKFKGYVAVPEGSGKHPGLILIHAIWGVDAHIKDVTERYAKQGFVVIAPDLLGNTGILEKISPTLFADLRDPEKKHAAQAKMRELMQPLSTQEFSDEALAKLEASFEFLSTHERCTGNIGILGFCFGGTYSFFLATKE